MATPTVLRLLVQIKVWKQIAYTQWIYFALMWKMLEQLCSESRYG